MQFNRAKEEGLIWGITLGQSSEVVTHLQFAGDAVVFCVDNEVEVANCRVRT